MYPCLVQFAIQLHGLFIDSCHTDNERLGNIAILSRYIVTQVDGYSAACMASSFQKQVFRPIHVFNTEETFFSC